MKISIVENPRNERNGEQNSLQPPSPRIRYDYNPETDKTIVTVFVERKKPADPDELIKEGYKVYGPYRDRRGKTYMKLKARVRYEIRIESRPIKYYMDVPRIERLKALADALHKYWLPKELPFMVVSNDPDVPATEKK